MMTGHAYSRAVRAHLLTSAALLTILLSNHEHQNDENQRQKMCSLQALLIDTDCSNVNVLEDTAIRDLRKTICIYSGFNTDYGSSEPLKTLVMLCYLKCHG